MCLQGVCSEAGDSQQHDTFDDSCPRDMWLPWPGRAAVGILQPDTHLRQARATLACMRAISFSLNLLSISGTRSMFFCAIRAL
jgi:hypothetical protein